MVFTITERTNIEKLANKIRKHANRNDHKRLYLITIDIKYDGGKIIRNFSWNFYDDYKQLRSVLTKNILVLKEVKQYYKICEKQLKKFPMTCTFEDDRLTKYFVTVTKIY